MMFELPIACDRQPALTLSDGYILPEKPSHRTWLEHSTRTTAIIVSLDILGKKERQKFSRIAGLHLPCAALDFDFHQEYWIQMTEMG